MNIVVVTSVSALAVAVVHSVAFAIKGRHGEDLVDRWNREGIGAHRGIRPSTNHLNPTGTSTS